MGETKKCKHCQSEIDKKAKVCPNCRRKQGGNAKFIIIGVFVVFIIVAALNGKDDEPKQATNTTNDSTADTKDNGDESDKAVSLGSEGQSGDLVLKVNEVGEAAEITENQFLSYKPDSGKYAIVNITIKNSGKEAISLTNGYFKLVTSDESEYKPTILIGLDNKYISFETINPKLDVTGNLIFEVPNDLEVSDATLKFSGTSLFTSSTEFNLK